MPTQSEIRQSVTDKLIQSLQNNELPPWRRSWSDDPNAPGLFTSLSTGNPYRGINQLLLQLASMRFGYKSKWFGTFNQIRNHNASVRKGEKGHKVILWKPVSRKRTDQNGEEFDDSFLVMREYTLFNAEQTTGLEEYRVGFCQPTDTVVERYEHADQLIDATEARIEYGFNQPAYRPHDDVIQLPCRQQFDTPESFYETVFHELVHWSEKPGRVGKKERHEYAFGELVAEIGACLLMAELRLPNSNLANSAAYVRGWLKGLQNDSRLIFNVSAQASRCVDYILACSQELADTPEAVATA